MLWNLFRLAVAIAVIGPLIIIGLVWWVGAFRPSEMLDQLKGKTLEVVVAAKGSPDKDFSFSMSVPGPNEPPARLRWRVLQRHYPHDRPENGKVQIRELQWVHWRYYVIIWFHQVDGQWVVLEAIERTKYGSD